MVLGKKMSEKKQRERKRRLQKYQEISVGKYHRWILNNFSHIYRYDHEEENSINVLHVALKGSMQ